MIPMRVLVVDDSALVRQIVTRILNETPRVEVVGFARNGVEAVSMVRELHPDVVTLDIQMPEMDGIEALKHIVRDSNARVVVLSSLDDPETTYRALEAGAVEFIAKPHEGMASSMGRLSTELVRAVRTAYAVSPDKRVPAGPPVPAAPAAPQPQGARPAQQPQPEPAASDPRQLVCIASSTGGPLALERVFAGLRSDTPTAYLVVQHLPAGFAGSFAARLGRVAGFTVIEAADGMRIRSGFGYVAPWGMHMEVTGAPGTATLIRLVDGPTLHGLKPSADPLFETAADCYGAAVTGVVLTGMGSDAALGMVAIKAAGGVTIAQDEDTSVVWGMPGAAVKLGAAQYVVPIDRVAVEIRRTLRGPEAAS
jgi:two-component system, chemotaxis family, protein-glutamate methylesterase/glutaminase